MSLSRLSTNRGPESVPLFSPSSNHTPDKQQLHEKLDSVMEDAMMPSIDAVNA